MRRERGHTLLEVTVVVTILASLAAAAAPSYIRTSEQTRVDACAAALRSVWSAQRTHWLESRAYAPTLETLVSEGHLDRAACEDLDDFTMQMTGVSTHAFTVTATRTGGAWAGAISVDQTGDLSGETTNGEGDHVAPFAK